MMRSAGALLAFATVSHAVATDVVAPVTVCDTSGDTVACRERMLTEVPAFRSNARKIDLSHNNIVHLFPEWKNRNRRDWTSPCNQEEFKDVLDDGTGVPFNAYGPSAAEQTGTGSAGDEGKDMGVAAPGDNVPGKTADPNNGKVLTTFPTQSLGCLKKLYELTLTHNTIASIPPLGSAAGGIGFTELGVLFLDSNAITELAANTFTGLEATLRQVSLQNNQITKLLPNTFDSSFVSLMFLDLRQNTIASFAVNFMPTSPPTLASAQFNFDQDSVASGNVLSCKSNMASSYNWWQTVSTSCECDYGHAAYPATGSEFNDVEAGEQYRVCRVGPTALSEIEALKVLLTSLEEKVTTIEGFGTTITQMQTDTAGIVTDLAQIHLKLDAAGCPKIGDRFRRSNNLN